MGPCATIDICGGSGMPRPIWNTKDRRCERAPMSGPRSLPLFARERKPGWDRRERSAGRLVARHAQAGTFTVPVCRVHHRELHRSGDEAARVNIDPLPVALKLWQHTRSDHALAAITQMA